MSILLKTRFMLEYAVVRVLLFLVDIMPLRFAQGLARSIGSLYFAADAKRRGIACDNVRRTGIAADEAEVRRIAKKSFQHFASLVVDSLKADKYLTPETWRDYSDMQVDPETESLIEKPGQGVILVSAHLGSWEVAAQIISYLKPVIGIARKMNNPYVERLIQKRKPRRQLKMTPKHDADMVRMLTALKEGNVLALLVDQHAREGAMMIDFFGTPAATHTSHAMLHLITKIPICFGYCVKTGPKRYKFVAGPPLSFERTGNRKQDVRNILEQLTSEMENAIRNYPEQYLWAHRRWRNLPDAKQPAGNQPVPPAAPSTSRTT